MYIVRDQNAFDLTQNKVPDKIIEQTNGYFFMISSTVKRFNKTIMYTILGNNIHHIFPRNQHVYRYVLANKKNLKQRCKIFKIYWASVFIRYGICTSNINNINKKNYYRY